MEKATEWKIEKRFLMKINEYFWPDKLYIIVAIFSIFLFAKNCINVVAGYTYDYPVNLFQLILKIA